MIIAIEGIDGSGKNTQSNLLSKKLAEAGYNVMLLGFPCYSETFFGKEVGNYLNGEFGSLDDVSPKLASLLYAGDRFEKKASILNALKDNKIIVIDRYVSSNVAHQTAKCVEEERAALQRWIEHLEYEVFGLPKAELNILLKINAKTSSELVQMKDTRDYTSKSHDIHEENSHYLEKVSGVYESLAENFERWISVNCLEDGSVRTKEDISNEIFELVLDFIR